MAGVSPTQRLAYLRFRRHFHRPLPSSRWPCPGGLEGQWLGVGAAARRAFCDPTWAGEGSYGQAVGPAKDHGDRRSAASALVRALDKTGYDSVFVNVLTSATEISANSYIRTEIPQNDPRNITPATYAAARAIREHVHATPRIRNDLIQRDGFSPERCVAIADAIAGARLTKVSPWPLSNGRLELPYLGRVEEAAKGVFSLPKILKWLDPTIFGHGALIAPLRFEGCCLRLIEVIVVGCVRVPQFTCAPPLIAPLLDPDQWELPKGIRPGLRTLLPTPVKNVLRVARERLAE